MPPARRLGPLQPRPELTAGTAGAELLDVVTGTGTRAVPAQRANAPDDGRRTSVLRDVPVQVQQTLRVLRRGGGDPTHRVEYGPDDGPVNAVWRASRTPEGPATLRVRAGRRVTAQASPAADECSVGEDEIELTAWGEGAQWLLKQGSALLGAEDDHAGFAEIAAAHPLLAEAHRRRPQLRLTRSGLMLEALIPAILEQKVTTHSAHSAWRRLVRSHGEPAPGPSWKPEGLYVPPTPHGWAMIPSWEWRRAEVDGKRAETIIRACRRAPAIERLAAVEAAEAGTKLQTIAGIGPWTAAETVQRSHGAADLVSVGDLHLPRIICGILAGPGETWYDDDRMLELLAPFAPHRQRAVRLLLSKR